MLLNQHKKKRKLSQKKERKIDKFEKSKESVFKVSFLLHKHLFRPFIILRTT